MNVPYGYRKEGDKLVVDLGKAEVVKLVHELRDNGVVEDDIETLLNEFSISKDGTTDLSAIRSEILIRADELKRERVERDEA